MVLATNDVGIPSRIYHLLSCNALLPRVLVAFREDAFGLLLANFIQRVNHYVLAGNASELLLVHGETHVMDLQVLETPRF